MRAAQAARSLTPRLGSCRNATRSIFKREGRGSAEKGTCAVSCDKSPGVASSDQLTKRDRASAPRLWYFLSSISDTRAWLHVNDSAPPTMKQSSRRMKTWPGAATRPRLGAAGWRSFASGAAVASGVAASCIHFEVGRLECEPGFFFCPEGLECKVEGGHTRGYCQPGAGFSEGNTTSMGGADGVGAGGVGGSPPEGSGGLGSGGAGGVPGFSGGGSAPVSTDSESDDAGVIDGADVGTDANLPDPVPEDPCQKQAVVPGTIALGDSAIALAELEAEIVLWLDPTTLPEPGHAIERWCDRSGRGNHATSGPGSEAVRVGVRGAASLGSPVNRVAVIDQSYLSLTASETFAFGREEFAVMVVASLPVERAAATYLYRATAQSMFVDLSVGDVPADGARATLGSPLQGALASPQSEAGLSGSGFQLYTLWRSAADGVQLRINGVPGPAGVVPVDAAFDLSSSPMTPPDVYVRIGTRASGTLLGKADIGAVIVLRRAHDASDVERIEVLLCSALGDCNWPRGTSRLDAGAEAR